MTGPSGRRFSWAMSEAAAFERYENGIERYHTAAEDDRPPSLGLASKLHGLIRTARGQEDHIIADALVGVLAGVQRRAAASAPRAADARFANDP